MSDSVYYERELIRIRPRCGADISTVIRHALILALQERCPVEFVFNDTPVRCDPSELVDGIYKGWSTVRGE